MITNINQAIDTTSRIKDFLFHEIHSEYMERLPETRDMFTIAAVLAARDVGLRLRVSGRYMARLLKSTSPSAQWTLERATKFAKRLPSVDNRGNWINRPSSGVN